MEPIHRRLDFRIPNRGVTLAILLIELLAVAAAAQTQPTRWMIDPQTSLAWWQMNPHFNHLWSTTCPQDPSWQPGEGRTVGIFVDYMQRPKTREAGIKDSRIPLYPRRTPRPVCGTAVHGTLAVADTVRWTGVRGTVAVTAVMLETGSDMRNKYLHTHLLESGRFPEIRFTLDSLTAVQPGDTLRATGLGTLELRGVQKRIEAGITAWHVARELRVLAHFQIPARALLDEFGMSRFALELGVRGGRWEELHMGVDLILKREQ